MMESLSKIASSASKLAFLTLIGTSCLAYLYCIFRGSIVMDSKDFYALVFAAAGFYFAHKGEATKDFAGK